MEMLGNLSVTPTEESAAYHSRPRRSFMMRDRVQGSIYFVALALSISVWFIAVRAPLWLDETSSYWQIHEGFSGILSHLGNLSTPAYPYILWVSTRMIGTSEIALRIPSVLAMLGAVYLLYLAARELFDPYIAIIATAVFCLHPVVVFASIDARPYAFAVLATNAAILVVVRLRRNDSNWMAALLGVLAGMIVCFHYLFATILPALVVCFFAVKFLDFKNLRRQLGVALGAFALTLIPVIPGLLAMFRSSGTHTEKLVPKLVTLFPTLAPGWLAIIFCAAWFIDFFIAAMGTRHQHSLSDRWNWRSLICASLAMIPILILYGVSAATPLYLLADRHRLVAVPGIALCWALLVSRFHFSAIRSLFCVVLVATTVYGLVNSPTSARHGYTWKYALAIAEKDASVDRAPVLICSGFVESNYLVMPVDSAKENSLFTNLSYYKLSVPVVPLPLMLNDEAIRVGSSFLQQQTQKHQRFLAVAHRNSYKTLDWLARSASGTYAVRKLGVFDEVEVLEFLPRIPTVTAH
jgi:4-amino-4-deoxy-L-arabinose transferase-like glycosyltransferase